METPVVLSPMILTWIRKFRLAFFILFLYLISLSLLFFERSSSCSTYLERDTAKQAKHARYWSSASLPYHVYHVCHVCHVLLRLAHCLHICAVL